jgi:altronate hydrolase
MLSTSAKILDTAGWLTDMNSAVRHGGTAIKLASNTPMYLKLEEDMDVNCGAILDGEVDVEQMGQRIFEAILRHASGEPTKSEALGLGDHEFVPWHLGIVS